MDQHSNSQLEVQLKKLQDTFSDLEDEVIRLQEENIRLQEEILMKAKEDRNAIRRDMEALLKEASPGTAATTPAHSSGTSESEGSDENKVDHLQVQVEDLKTTCQKAQQSPQSTSASTPLPPPQDPTLQPPSASASPFLPPHQPLLPAPAPTHLFAIVTPPGRLITREEKRKMTPRELEDLKRESWFTVWFDAARARRLVHPGSTLDHLTVKSYDQILADSPWMNPKTGLYITPVYGEYRFTVGIGTAANLTPKWHICTLL